MAEIDHEPEWRKSSRSGASNCVEVAIVSATVLVRDSKNPNGSPLSFTHEQWTTFLESIKSGVFDAAP